MSNIKWCVIGAGGIADRRTIPAIISDKNNELVAVMDKAPNVAKQIGEKYGVKYYFDEETMLKENECDCVYISTPVFCHYQQAMLALKYDKHVFLEKPVGFNAKEGKEILDAFREKNKQLSIGYMMKYHNLNQKTKSLIEEGMLGQIATLRMQFTCWYPDIEGAWRQKKALGGGGALMDLGVHCIELVEYVLDDKILEVKGFMDTRTFSYEVEDEAVFVFKTEKGVLGHIDVNFNIPDKASESKFEIYGTKGYVICKGTLAQEEVGTMEYLYAPQGDYSAKQERAYEKPELFYGEKGNLYLKQINDFAKLIRAGKVDYSHAERAVHVQEIVDELYK